MSYVYVTFYYLSIIIQAVTTYANQQRTLKIKTVGIYNKYETKCCSFLKTSKWKNMIYFGKV